MRDDTYRPHEKDSGIQHTGGKGFWPVPDSEYSVKAQEPCTPNEPQSRSAPSSTSSPRMIEGMPPPYPTVPSTTPFETDLSTLTSFLVVRVTKLEGREIDVDAEPQPGKRWSVRRIQRTVRQKRGGRGLHWKA